MKTKSARKSAPSSVISGSIVCGTDFSRAAEVAVDIATDLARRLDVPLTLAHAVELPRLLAENAKASHCLEASRKRSLREVAAGSRKRGVQVLEFVRAGRAEKLLVETAAAEKARMIVVSSHGDRRPGKWFLGRVAERTAEFAETPVLVLRDARPLHAWLRGKRPLKVFVAYNFTTTSNVALRWVKRLAGVGPCEVVLGYINRPIEDHVRIGARGPLPFGENSRDVLAVLDRDMKARARAVLGDIPVHCRVAPHGGGVDAHLAKMAEEEGADLIVAGSHQYAGFQRLWHASVSRGLLSHAARSVAIVPVATARGRGPVRAPSMRHILLATDFSPEGNAAIPHALLLLRGGGILTLLHVTSLPLAIGDRSQSDHGRAPEPLVSTVRATSARLRRLVPSEADDQGIQIQVKVVSASDAGVAISQTAERLGVDVICLGSGRRTEISRTFLGSVTRTVRSITRRPLLLVPAPEM